MNDKMKICIVCVEYNAEKKVCNKCGCYMPLKSTIPFAKCPLGKW